MCLWEDYDLDPFEDEDEGSRCRYCGKEIVWGYDERGRPVPFRNGQRHNCRIAPRADDFDNLTEP